MEDLEPFLFIKTWQTFLKCSQSLAFTWEKFQKLKYTLCVCMCVRDHSMTKVNKKKNVNNNNVLKIESEHLRLAILLNNNLEFQYKWNLIYKYILIFIKFSTHFYYIYRNKMHAIFVLNVLNDCEGCSYIYINTWTQLKINYLK